MNSVSISIFLPLFQPTFCEFAGEFPAQREMVTQEGKEIEGNANDEGNCASTGAETKENVPEKKEVSESSPSRGTDKKKKAIAFIEHTNFLLWHVSV